MNRIDFEHGTVTGNILGAALPMLVSQSLNLLNNIVDRIYIARIPNIGTAALGADGGLSAVEGFMSSARFMQYMAGTTGLAFNFSDARETTQSFPAMLWNASK